MSNNTTEDEEERSTIVVIRVSREQTDLVVPLFIAYGGLYGKTVSVEEARSYLEEGLAQGDSVIFLAVQQSSPGGDRRPVGFVQMHPSRSSALLGFVKK